MSLNATTTSVVTQSRQLHHTIVGAFVGGIIFVACWLLAFTPIAATHSIIALVTKAETTSALALVQGISWSLFFGASLGFLIATVDKFVVGLVVNR